MTLTKGKAIKALTDANIQEPNTKLETYFTLSQDADLEDVYTRNSVEFPATQVGATPTPTRNAETLKAVTALAVELGSIPFSQFTAKGGLSFDSTIASLGYVMEGGIWKMSDRITLEDAIVYAIKNGKLIVKRIDKKQFLGNTASPTPTTSLFYGVKGEVTDRLGIDKTVSFNIVVAPAKALNSQTECDKFTAGFLASAEIGQPLDSKFGVANGLWFSNDQNSIVKSSYKIGFDF
jgi:hypothetical protein